MQALVRIYHSSTIRLLSTSIYLPKWLLINIFIFSSAIPAQVVMDVPAHLSKTEIIGLLGGYYNQSKHQISVEIALPCSGLSTSIQVITCDHTFQSISLLSCFLSILLRWLICSYIIVWNGSTLWNESSGIVRCIEYASSRMVSQPSQLFHPPKVLYSIYISFNSFHQIISLLLSYLFLYSISIRDCENQANYQVCLFYLLKKEYLPLNTNSNSNSNSHMFYLSLLLFCLYLQSFHPSIYPYLRRSLPKRTEKNRSLGWLLALMKNIQSTVLNSTTFSLAMNGIPIIHIVSLFKILSIIAAIR